MFISNLKLLILRFNMETEAFQWFCRDTATFKREQLQKKLENRCYVCERHKGLTKSKIRRLSLSFHRINGKLHPKAVTHEGLDFINSHIDEFVLLCSYCHGMVHKFKNSGKKYLFSDKIRYLASFL